MIKRKYVYVLLAPMLLLMGGLVCFPVIRTFFYSIHRYKLTQPHRIKLIGWDNYVAILKSGEFYEALMNSMLVLVLVVSFVWVASMFVGLLLNVTSRWNGILTAIAMVPWALPPLVNGIVWRFIFHPSYGYLNKILLSSGLIHQPIQWTNNRWGLLVIVSIVVAWRVVPFCAVLIMATLQTIPKDWYEAAYIDGANSFKKWQFITLPYLKPTLYIVLIQATMAAMNVFDEVVAFIGYRYEGQTLLLYNYLKTFSFLDFGYGSAVTYLVMVLSGIIGYYYIKSVDLREV